MKVLICDRCQDKLTNYVFFVRCPSDNVTNVTYDLCEKCAKDFKTFMQSFVQQKSTGMSEQEAWRKGLM